MRRPTRDEAIRAAAEVFAAALIRIETEAARSDADLEAEFEEVA